MRRKTTGLVLALAAGAALVLSGCGPMTPKKLAAKVEKAVEQTPYSQAELDMTLEMSLAEPTTGIEMDVGFQIGGEMQVSYDPSTVYENLDCTIEIMGLRVPSSMEVYTLQEGDKLATYTNTAGSWTRSESDPAAQTSETASIALWDLPADQLTIDEEVTELDGTPAYCLTGTVSGQQLSQAMGFLFNSLGDTGGLPDQDMLLEDAPADIDWDQVSAQMVAYVDSNTYLPLREEITLSGLDEAMDLPQTEGSVSLQIKNTRMTVTYTSYEPVSPCVLPEGAKEAAAQSQRLLEGNPDNGDGTYTLQESGFYVDIQAPEGYTLAGTNYDEVDFYNEELDRTVRYQVYITADSNDLWFWQMVCDEESLYAGEVFTNGRMASKYLTTDNFTYCVDGFTYSGENYTAGNYYAWANLDDTFYGWVVVTIYDGGKKQDSAITTPEIQDLLDLATPYQLPEAQSQVEDLLNKLEL